MSLSTREKVKRGLREVEFILILVVLVFGVRHSLAENYKIPSGSMEPTLKVGDYLFASKCSYFLRFPYTDWILMKTGDVDRGDIVIFPSVEDPKVNLIKRVIGLPGDHIKIRRDRLYINGQALPVESDSNREDLYDIDYAEQINLFRETTGGVEHAILLHKEYSVGDNFSGVIVPEGKIFVMGDNRDQSRDSRYFGFVPIRSIRGKAGVIYLSMDKSSGFPWRFRYERLGHVVR